MRNLLAALARLFRRPRAYHIAASFNGIHADTYYVTDRGRMSPAHVQHVRGVIRDRLTELGAQFVEGHSVIITGIFPLSRRGELPQGSANARAQEEGE